MKTVKTKYTVAKALNEFCPNSGEAIREDSLVEYRGQIFGFCNSECSGKFLESSEKSSKAKLAFDSILEGLR